MGRAPLDPFDPFPEKTFHSEICAKGEVMFEGPLPLTNSGKEILPFGKHKFIETIM